MSYFMTHVSYPTYYKVVVKIISHPSHQEQDRILKNYKSFYEWATENLSFEKQDINSDLYAQIKVFVEKTCGHLRFAPRFRSLANDF